MKSFVIIFYPLKVIYLKVLVRENSIVIPRNSCISSDSIQFLVVLPIAVLYPFLLLITFYFHLVVTELFEKKDDSSSLLVTIF